MTTRPRAPKTKSRLREITLERSPKGTNSLDVVTVFKGRYPQIDEQERQDLVDLGLMVLAGRASLTNALVEGHADLFNERGCPDFVNVRVKEGNRFNVLRKLGRDITPREYFEHTPSLVLSKQSPPKLSRQQTFHTLMVEMKDRGFGDLTVPDYLATLPKPQR